jgi:hypothetical protein
VSHDNLVERRDPLHYGVYIIYPISAANGRNFKYLKAPYTNEVDRLNNVGVGIALYTMDEFIKILDK